MNTLLITAFIGGGPGGFELLLIFGVLLLLFGAKNLPQIARTIGKTLEQFQRAAREVKEEVIRAGDVDDYKRDTPPPIPGQISRLTEDDQTAVDDAVAEEPVKATESEHSDQEEVKSDGAD